MNKEERKHYEAKSEIFKALAHPTRLWIVEQLSDGERCVCEFVDKLDVDFSTISKHLSVLRHAGIIEREKRGKQVFYNLRVTCVLSFMNCVDAVVKSIKN